MFLDNDFVVDLRPHIDPSIRLRIVIITNHFTILVACNIYSNYLNILSW